MTARVRWTWGETLYFAVSAAIVFVGCCVLVAAAIVMLGAW